MSRTLVKICGVRDAAMALVAADAGADFVGVVLVRESPRFVDPAEAPALAVAIADAGAMPVAVVRLPVDDAVRAALDAFPIVQFHGGETPEEIAAFARRREWECWKGVAFGAGVVERWLDSGAVARVVVDGPDAGSGVGFDHAAFGAIDAARRARCLLAGGLDAATVGGAIAVAAPGGVDVSSGVERSRGVKDAARIEAFVRAVEVADARARDGGATS
ncbi:MAG: N-(5-phosphoribosyl)anthranilate isomerase [Planctomycetota bacterium]